MKFSSLRRTGALLLALTLVCSLLTLPVAAADEIRVRLNNPNLELKMDGKTSDTISVGQMSSGDKRFEDDEVDITYKAEPEDTISVDSSGVVTALKAGSATVTVTVTEKNPQEDTAARTGTATCSVTVIGADVDVDWIELDHETLEMTVGGEDQTLTTIIHPANATNKEIVYESSDLSIVSTVSQNKGILHAVAPGTATITATAKGGDASAACKVTVINAPPKNLTLDKREASVLPGGKVTLTATISPENAFVNKVQWISSSNIPGITVSSASGDSPNTSVASISVANNVEAGTKVTITARIDDEHYHHISDFCVIEVGKTPPPGVVAVDIVNNAQSSNYVDPGKTLQLTANVSPVTAPEAGKVTWKCNDTSIATVNPNTGLVTGVAPGAAIITATAGGLSGTLEIEVSGIELSYLRRSTTGGQGVTVELTPESVVDIYQYRDIVVNYKTYGNARLKTINWESSNPSVAQVVNGRVTGNYPGDNVTITAAVAGTSFSTTFKVRVSEDVAEAITVNMGSDPSYSFANLLTQLNSRSQSKAGDTLDNVYNLKVSTKNGVLYYGYTSPQSPGHGVGGTERYYYQPSGQGQMALRDVTFVPNVGFDGVAVVDYNAVSTNGTTFTGTIRIEATATGDVSYSTGMDEPITFAASHFAAICQSRNGQSIRYITFDLPNSNRGTLYYNYSPDQFSSKVTSTTRYYANSNPSINQVTFVPAAGYMGQTDVTYHCTDSSGATYAGVIRIIVGSGSSSQSNANVEYYTAVNQRQNLYSSDFNNASQRVTDTNLNYIRFDSLPSTNLGRLYLNYSTSSNTGTQAATGRNYYRNTNPRISDLTFVPASGYSGTVTIPYTGVTTSGSSFTGNLVIYVGNYGSRVRYTVAPNQSVSFKAADFNAACRSATGDTLNYVIFNLPSSTYGTLYYQYNATGRTGTPASSTTGYYYSGGNRLLDDLSFAAGSNTGTTTFRYTGYSTQRDSFTGTVEIQITGGGTGTGTSGSSIHYTGSSAPISFRSSDFQSACQATLGTTLTSVQFDRLPDIGHLYQDYSGPAQTGANVASGTRYGIQDLDRISYLPKAESQGLVTIPFTAFDAQGGNYSGVVSIQLSSTYCTTPFTDVAGIMDWARPSIEFLRRSGVTNGYSDGTFRPLQNISRGEFTLMLCRAFQFPTTGTSGFSDVPASSVYAGAIGSARSLGIVQGNNGLFRPSQPITRQSAMTMIYRAMNAAGKAVPDASTGLLSNYVDGGQVSASSRTAVASLIQLGAVKGSADMRLNPTSSISRAEMAVILHRVLAQ